MRNNGNNWCRNILGELYSNQLRLAKMLCLRLTALFLALVAAANATVTGDCADVYDTGSGNCNASLTRLSNLFNLI